MSTYQVMCQRSIEYGQEFIQLRYVNSFDQQSSSKGLASNVAPPASQCTVTRSSNSLDATKASNGGDMRTLAETGAGFRHPLYASNCIIWW